MPSSFSAKVKASSRFSRLLLLFTSSMSTRSGRIAYITEWKATPLRQLRPKSFTSIPKRLLKATETECFIFVDDVQSFTMDLYSQNVCQIKEAWHTWLLCIAPIGAWLFQHCPGTWSKLFSSWVGLLSQNQPCYLRRMHCWTEPVGLGGYLSALQSAKGISNGARMNKLTFSQYQDDILWIA